MSVIILVYFSHTAYFLCSEEFRIYCSGVISYRRVYHVHAVVIVVINYFEGEAIPCIVF
jgi:hypothetical protein